MTDPPFEVTKPEHTRHLNMIIYGLTGAGKTQLAGTASRFPGTSPTLFIDVEGGLLSLHGVDVDVARPKNWTDIQEIYDYLYFENDRYNSVVIDSLTEMQRKLSMGFVMGELSETDYYSRLESSRPPDRQDWLRTGEQMRKFIRAFRDLAYLEDPDRRVHVIMTALEKADDRRRSVNPQLPGQLGIECGAFVDVLARLSIVNVNAGTDDEPRLEQRRHLLTMEYEDDAGTRFLAKNRGGRLGRQMWNPTIEKIVSPWGERKEKDAD